MAMPRPKPPVGTLAASTALWLLFASGSTNAQTPDGIPSPAAQAGVAHESGNGAPLFVSADADLKAKGPVSQDSWFVISHVTAGSSSMDLMIHYIRLMPPQGEPFVQAILSVLDPATGKSIAEEVVYPVPQTTLSDERLNVITPSGGMTGNASQMRVTGKFKRVTADLTLSHRGPMLANLGNGILPFYGDINYEYALPDMTTTGSVTIDGKRYTVAGSSWFDRQWGMMEPGFWGKRQWSWMGISLDNGDRISLWDIVYKGKSNAFATIVHPNGRHELVEVTPLAAGASDVWTAPSGQRYPTKWSVSIPQLQGSFQVVPLTREQEVQSPIKAHKYEGASSVVGTIQGRPVKGHAVVELVGDWR